MKYVVRIGHFSFVFFRFSYSLIKRTVILWLLSSINQTKEKKERKLFSKHTRYKNYSQERLLQSAAVSLHFINKTAATKTSAERERAKNPLLDFNAIKIDLCFSVALFIYLFVPVCSLFVLRTQATLSRSQNKIHSPSPVHCANVFVCVCLSAVGTVHILCHLCCVSGKMHLYI